MKYFDLIESYSNGTMSETEIQAFEQSLASNPDIRQEWENYKLTLQVSGVLAYENAKHKISGIQQSSLRVAHRNKPQRQLLRIAASLLVLVVLGFVFSQVRYSDSALASRHYLTASFTMRSPQSDGTAKLIDAGKYEEAMSILEHASADDAISKSLYAEALTKLERYPDAIALYKELAEDPQNVNRDGAEFALALLYLKTGDNTTASDLISRIATSDDHDYRFEARKLNSQLKSFWRKLVL